MFRPYRARKQGELRFDANVPRAMPWAVLSGPVGATEQKRNTEKRKRGTCTNLHTSLTRNRGNCTNPHTSPKRNRGIVHLTITPIIVAHPTRRSLACASGWYRRQPTRLRLHELAVRSFRPDLQTNDDQS